MSRYSLFLDVAGRLTEEAEGYSTVTAAVVALPTESVDAIRAKLPPSLPKWREASPADCRVVLDVLAQTAVAFLAFRVTKSQPAWEQFWSDSEAYLQRLLATNPGRRKEANFVRAANVIKFWLFGEPSARLVGECVRREGAPRILDYRERGIVDVTVICDADIQGGYNIETFKYLWENSNQADILSRVGLFHHTRSVDLKSEQEEPLLMLPDHLAGLVHARLGTPEVSLPQNMDPESVQELYGILESSPKFVLVPYDFDLQYADIFGATSLGKELWPTFGSP